MNVLCHVHSFLVYILDNFSKISYCLVIYYPNVRCYIARILTLLILVDILSASCHMFHEFFRTYRTIYKSSWISSVVRQ
jgi:hypothetical protein